MSRNRKQMSTDIFDRIHAAAFANDENYVADSHPRWIARKDDVDADLMANAEIRVLPLGMQIFSMSVSYKTKRFFCFSGLPKPAEVPVGLSPVDATPGLFACAVVLGDMPAIASAAQVLDAIGQQYHGIDGYYGHDLSDILLFFPEISFFEVSDGVDENYLLNLERVAGSYVSRGYQKRPLDLNPNTLKKLVELFEGGPDAIPYHLPLQGVMSYSWPSLFLDLYRCLEQLYSAPRLANLIEKVHHDGSLSDLARILENVLSWRPREEESLATLLNKLSRTARESLISSFFVGQTDLSEATGEKCASYVYKLRNSHVHFRPAMSADKISSYQWNSIISAMCDAVIEVYLEMGGSFFDKNLLKSRIETVVSS